MGRAGQGQAACAAGCSHAGSAERAVLPPARPPARPQAPGAYTAAGTWAPTEDDAKYIEVGLTT